MVVSIFLYPVLYGLELFLASALITQIAVSLAAVVVSTVTIYFCKKQLVYWHQERVLKRRGRWQSDVTVKSYKRQRHADNSESSEGELSDSSLLRRLRAGLRSRSHERVKTKGGRESSDKRSSKLSPQVPEEAKKDTADSGSVRPKLTKQVGAMHRSHWVAKPQQSLPTVHQRSSESDTELRGGGCAPSPDCSIQEEPIISVATALMMGQTGSKTQKRSRATAHMTLKKHPRFSSSDSSSSASPASSSAESDDLVHGELADKTEPHTETLLPTRRVPSIQVEPIVEERIIPIGPYAPSQPPPSKLKESTSKEISRLEFSLAVVGSDSHWHPIDAACQSNTVMISQDEPSPAESGAVAKEQAINDSPDISNVPSISTTEVLPDDKVTTEKQDSSALQGLQRHRRHSLGVPPVIAGEEAYPEGVADSSGDRHTPFVWVSEMAVGSSDRPLILGPSEGLSVTSGAHSLLAGDESGVASCQVSTPPSLPSTAGDKMDDIQGKRMHSLDVPSTITGEVCFPPLMLSGSEEQIADEDHKNNGQTACIRKIIKIRPKSLDIPPILPAPCSKSSQSAPPSPPCSAGHGVKRKHTGAKSILKRSGSMERPGRKKSVSFSPEVSPREFEVERCYDLDHERMNAPKRPRVFRHFSMDIPDARMVTEDDISLSTPRRAWSEGDAEDSDSPDSSSPAAVDSGDLLRAEGWVHPSPLEPMQIEGSDARMAFVPISALESESGRKSAKERFLEAGGAKAVLSVLCTQDSSDSNGNKYSSVTASAPNTGTDSSVNDGSEEDSMETMPDVDQSLSVTAEGDDEPSHDHSADLSEEATVQELPDFKGIKSRFLEYEEDSADIHTSRLFVQTVRSSVESDSSDEQDRSHCQQLETKVDGKLDCTCEDQKNQATSAKSRFLQSCQHADGDSKVQNGSRFVVSVVRPYNSGCHKQDSPSNDCGESKEADVKQTWNREVPDSGNANTWRSLLAHELSEDIEFYEMEPKTSRDDKPMSVSGTDDLSLQQSGIKPSDSIEVVHGTGRTVKQSERQHSDSYSAGTSLQYSPTYSENAAVVIDNGSEVLKVGFSGDIEPRYTIPSVVGRYAGGDVTNPADLCRASYVGHDATRRAGLMSFYYPLTEGIVHNWEDLEQIWNYVFTSLLNVAPQEHPILLSEYASTTKRQREKLVEILFEKLQVPSLCLVNQGALALHAQGDTSGIVLSSGGGLTEVVPVLDGYTMHYAVTTLKVAGSQVTNYLGRLLQPDSDYNLTSPSQLDILKNIKETMAYVCMDYEREMERISHLDSSEYKLPDGSSLTVKCKHLFRCTEQLFKPDFSGLEQQAGIHDMIQETLKRCDPTVLAGIGKSLLLSGGNTQLKGFGDRVQLELASAHMPWSVSMPQERTNSVWIGGSVVATHDGFWGRCVSARDYAEHGAAVIHPKCF